MPYTLMFEGISVVAETVDDVAALLQRMNGHRPAKAGRPRSNGATSAAAHRAKYSPGSLEARVLAHLKTSGPISPGELTAAVKADKYNTTKALKALAKAGKVKVSGATTQRRVALA